MLGDLVHEARLRHGLSQRRLAIRSGVTQASISRIERGIEAPGWARFEQLMIAMGQRPAVRCTPIEHALDEGELRLAATRTPAQRFGEAASWNRFASSFG